MAVRNRKGKGQNNNNNNNNNKKSSLSSTKSKDKNTEPRSASPSPTNSQNQKRWIGIMISLGCVMAAVVAASVLWKTPSQDANSTTTTTTTTTTSKVDSSPTPTVPDTTTTTTLDDSPPHILARVGPDYQVLKVMPHDETSFTQGLLIHNDKIYEGTGNYGESVIRSYDQPDAKILQEISLDDQYFGEGLSSLTTNTTQDDGSNVTTTRLIQLTYKEQTGFLYDIDTLEVVQEFKYITNTTEGWGITFDGARHELLVSDGSEWIHVWDATTLQEKRRYAVTFQSQHSKSQHRPPMAVQHLNELEFDAATHTLLANVWYQNIVLRIDPTTGQVLRVYDMGQLYPMTDRSDKADSFNGIAMVAGTNDIWVTGKWWPHMYLVRLLA
jgi:glutamine cyclotransferase